MAVHTVSHAVERGFRTRRFHVPELVAGGQGFILDDIEPRSCDLPADGRVGQRSFINEGTAGSVNEDGGRFHGLQDGAVDGRIAGAIGTGMRARHGSPGGVADADAASLGGFDVGRVAPTPLRAMTFSEAAPASISAVARFAGQNGTGDAVEEAARRVSSVRRKVSRWVRAHALAVAGQLYLRAQ